MEFRFYASFKTKLSFNWRATEIQISWAIIFYLLIHIFDKYNVWYKYNPKIFSSSIIFIYICEHAEEQNQTQ